MLKINGMHELEKMRVDLHILLTICQSYLGFEQVKLGREVGQSIFIIIILILYRLLNKGYSNMNNKHEHEHVARCSYNELNELKK